MGELGRLIQQFRDGERGVISDAEIGRQAGVSRSTVGGWIRGTSGLPMPENLRALARYMGVPYDRVLQAALADAGYYGTGSDHARQGPTTQDDPVRVVTADAVAVPVPPQPPAGARPRRGRAAPASGTD